MYAVYADWLESGKSGGAIAVILTPLDYLRCSAHPTRLPSLSLRPDMQAIPGAVEKTYALIVRQARVQESAYHRVVPCHTMMPRATASQTLPNYSLSSVHVFLLRRSQIGDDGTRLFTTCSACSSATVDQTRAQVWFLQRWWCSAPPSMYFRSAW